METLKSVRQLAKLSIQEVAEAMDTSVAMIYAYERGAKHPSFQRIIALSELVAERLECSRAKALIFLAWGLNE